MPAPKHAKKQHQELGDAAGEGSLHPSALALKMGAWVSPSLAWCASPTMLSLRRSFSESPAQTSRKAVLEGHRQRRRNTRAADWLIVAGRLAIAYNHPDGDDDLVALVVTLWRTA
jgi:hypothetical protein